ncbi:MAG: helix-turn-helix domain-containing protein [Clostridia bacterium]|nr:helix-turn-helix domain-containing protein [Clostridia bacterium]
MNFPQKLKDLRKEKGITQKQLADILGTTDDSIYSWEHGRSQPSLEMLQSIITYFGISADYLFETNGYEN